MIDIFHISNSIYLRTEDKQTLKFDLTPSSQRPTPKECNRRIIGINLSYGNCAEQLFGIQPMRIAFGNTDKKNIITK